MRFSSTSSRFSASVGSISQHFSRWFPTPRLLVPLSAGIDISDASIKWVVLDRLGGNLRVINYGFERLAVGIVADGIIHEEEALVLALARVRSRLGGINHVHAALPEEAAYVFSMHVPEESDRGQIISMIEFESEDRVPVPVNASVYDYDIITEHDGDIVEEVGVSVFPRELAEAYTSVFDAAGFELQSGRAHNSFGRFWKGPNRFRRYQKRHSDFYLHYQSGRRGNDPQIDRKTLS